MIDRLTITNFKAFAAADLPLGPYTLLSGLNSSGKSTVLQALALLRQAFDQDMLHDPDDSAGFPLNGVLAQLGTGRDVLHEDYVAKQGGEPEIGFRLSAAGVRPGEWRARYGREDDLLPLTASASTKAEDSTRVLEDGLDAFTVFNDGFQYLRADRVNPAVTYPRSHEMSAQREFLGAHGEFTVDYLGQHQDDVVRHDVLHHPDASPRLLEQVEAWMSEICPGVRIQATVIELTDLMRLGFQFTRAGQVVSAPRRPTNVGFGLGYALPIVVACLTAKPGALLLLENPEAHVHPQGQSAMARLSCAAASAGAQVIVETHSDHILNGVRLVVKRGQIPADDVILHYFDRQDDGVHVVSPVMGADGMLSQWPSGFFDEWDRSIDQLLELTEPGTEPAEGVTDCPS
jgi:predicted ATPase